LFSDECQLCCVDEIAWYELCESRPETKEQTVLCFGELANAFRLLHHHLSSQWTDDAVISVIDEMICKCFLVNAVGVEMSSKAYPGLRPGSRPVQ